MKQEEISQPIVKQEYKQVIMHLHEYVPTYPFMPNYSPPFYQANHLPTTNSSNYKQFISEGKLKVIRKVIMDIGLKRKNKRYHWFLEIYYRHFINSHMRRTDKIFKTMENFIGSRLAEQCRSHHQKMEKKFSSFTSIITHFRTEIYRTLETEPIIQQLEKLKIDTEGELATMEELLAYQEMDQAQRPRLNKRKHLPKMNKIESKIHQEFIKPISTSEEVNKVLKVKMEEQSKQESNKMNMFEDCQPNLGDIAAFNQKEENSFISYSIFQNQPQ